MNQIPYSCAETDKVYFGDFNLLDQYIRNIFHRISESFSPKNKFEEKVKKIKGEFATENPFWSDANNKFQGINLGECFFIQPYLYQERNKLCLCLVIDKTEMTIYLFENKDESITVDYILSSHLKMTKIDYSKRWWDQKTMFFQLSAAIRECFEQKEN